jgi:hypothetical protein
MKKITNILALLFITSIPALKAQTYISGYSCYIDDDGEWTDWIEENVEIKIDGKGGVITLFDPVWLSVTEYKIISVGKSETDEDDDIAIAYQCKDNKDIKWTVTVTDLVTTDPGKLQINFSNDIESTSYHVIKSGEE